MRAPSQEAAQQESATKTKSKQPPSKHEPVPAIPTKIGTVDIEAFSRNLARLVEEGGRALAAYLKPREE
ncbi:MAG TPA: class I poly(R)-hydroxyalkanoic acid synthase, partial [Xanthobacteraceae bacterium]